MKSYESYKGSGFDWLGKIPPHWKLIKNRYGFEKKSNGLNKDEKTKVLSLTTKGIKIKEDLTFGKSSETFIGHQLVQKGDIVFTPRDFDQTPILSDVSKFDGCISNLYIVDSTKSSVFNYFVNYFWYGLKYSVDYFKNFSHGMRYSFNRFQFDEIPLLVPPYEEQKKIVKFLDNKCQKINFLIEKIQSKIKLLKELRTSTINQCITKGLDLNIETRDSGIKWIGKIPSHWKLKKFKFLGKAIIGLTYKPEDTVDKKNGVLVLRASNIQNEKLSFKDNVYVKSKITENLRVKEGDILICSRSGSRNLIGKNCLLTNESKGMTWGVFMTVYRSKFSKFLFWILNSTIFKSQTGMFLTSTINQLTIYALNNMIFPFVSEIEEQNKIIKHLEKRTTKIDNLTNKEIKRIKLLELYRQSLISNVVTGKIDIRNEVTS